MCRGGHDADFHSLLISGLTGCETAVGGIAVVSLNGIAEVVGEHGDACHACHILLESSLFCGQRRIAGSPALAIYKNRRIDFLEFTGDTIHCLYVVDTHEVEAETVDMEFLCPVFH